MRLRVTRSAFSRTSVQRRLLLFLSCIGVTLLLSEILVLSAQTESAVRQEAAKTQSDAGSLDLAKRLLAQGNAASGRRDYAQAEDYYRRAASIQQALEPNSLVTASTLSALAGTFENRDDYAHAEEYFRR